MSEFPVTVVDVSNNRVTQIKTPENDGYAAANRARFEQGESFWIHPYPPMNEATKRAALAGSGWYVNSAPVESRTSMRAGGDASGRSS